MATKATSRRKFIKACGIALTASAVPFLPKAASILTQMKSNKIFDVLIIGGSYAGLSAAMALGRSLRTVLIIDSGLPCNWQTPHSHNFLTQDGKTPKEISTIAKNQVVQYETVQFYTGIATSGRKMKEGFEITTGSGETFSGKKLIFATGIKDILPDIKGFAACWGISVIHCPYCHGYEFRNQKTGIIANGDRAFHLALLVNNLTNDITIFTSGKAAFSAEQIIKLNNHNIEIVETKISEIEHQNGHVKSLVFSDGTKRNFAAVYAAVPFVQHSDIPVLLGCQLTEQGYLKTDNFQKTSVPGIFACGDAASMMRSVANAVATGSFAGAMTNKELTDEQF